MNHYGLNLNEYLLIIEPETSVRQQIQSLKQAFKDRYRFKNAVISKAHITLMRCLQYESYEQLIVRKLRAMSTCVTPFGVELKGFGNFGHTLYIDVKTHTPILNIVTNRRAELRPFLHNGAKGTPFFTTRPHITIARGLTPTQCQMAWTNWSRMPFCSFFRATEMVLLKRQAGRIGYRRVARFNFTGRVSLPTQGILFN